MVVDRYRLHVEPFLDGGRNHVAVAERSGKARQKLHAGIVFGDGDPFAEMLAAELYEVRLAARVEPAHPLEVRREITLLDEVVDGCLQDERRELAGDADRLVEGIRQFARHDQVADAERRDQRLAEAADVDDAVRMIEAAQRRNGAAAEPVLAVVVVLDDPGAVAFGDVEELQPLLDAHDRAERPLA